MTLIEKISKKTSTKIIDYLSIKDEYKVLEVHYSIERFYNTILFIILFTIIIYLEELIFNLNILDDAIILYFFFSLIRSNFGGFHFQKDWVCLLTSVVTIVGGSIISGLITINLMSMILLYVFVYYTIFYKKVVDNPNKRLSDKRKKIFFKRGLVVVTIILVVHFLFFIFNKSSFVNSIYIALLLGFLNLYLVDLKSNKTPKST